MCVARGGFAARVHGAARRGLPAGVVRVGNATLGGLPRGAKNLPAGWGEVSVWNRMTASGSRFEVYRVHLPPVFAFLSCDWVWFAARVHGAARRGLLAGVSRPRFGPTDLGYFRPVKNVHTRPVFGGELHTDLTDVDEKGPYLLRCHVQDATPRRRRRGPRRARPPGARGDRRRRRRDPVAVGR